jgi:hypothetical protein
MLRLLKHKRDFPLFKVWIVFGFVVLGLAMVSTKTV